MTTKHDQEVKDEAAAEERYQREQGGKPKTGKAGKIEKAARVKNINLSSLAADAPSESSPFVQASLADPETKKLFEALIDEIRRVGAGGGGGTGGSAGVPASVVADLNALRDSIMLTNASLDADTGVATNTYAANGDPPPITTAA